jgi:hypothetical protein
VPFGNPFTLIIRPYFSIDLVVEKVKLNDTACLITDGLINLSTAKFKIFSDLIEQSIPV